MSNIEPGYYPDQTTGQLRWWDGNAWGPYASPSPMQTFSPGTNYVADPRNGLAAAGYVLAVLMPLVGFIIGIVLATRPHPQQSKHGVWVIVLSIAAFFFWFAVIAAMTRSAIQQSCIDVYGNSSC